MWYWVSWMSQKIDCFSWHMCGKPFKSLQISFPEKQPGIQKLPPILGREISDKPVSEHVQHCTQFWSLAEHSGGVTVNRVQQLTEQITGYSHMVHLGICHKVESDKHEGNSGISNEVRDKKINVGFRWSHLRTVHYLRDKRLDKMGFAKTWEILVRKVVVVVE